MIFKILPVAVCLMSCFGNQPKQQDQPKKQNISYAYQSQRIYGSYNWRDSFDFSDFIGGDYDGTYVIDFEPNYLEDYRFLNPLWIDSTQYYCRRIEFSYTNDYCEVALFSYTRDDFKFTFPFLIDDGISISQISYEGTGTAPGFDVILNVREAYYTDSTTVDIFNAIFTHDDNAYTYTYSGYYNFNSNLSSIVSAVGVYGYLNFNNYIYFGFTNKFYSSVSVSDLYFEYYKDEAFEFDYYPYSLPFDNNTVLSKNILMSGCKMSIDTYTRLSNRGIFAYQRDTTYDDTDFEGLLFTIADTPVYFLSQFLNFELFGMNLFLALSGLITLIIVIFILRKVHTLG